MGITLIANIIPSLHREYHTKMASDKPRTSFGSVSNGPVAQNVKEQHAKATAEFSNLAAARQTPSTPAATGQPLTHYHSFFSELLSWNNPRASAIAYVAIITAIFAARYLDLLRWAFRLTWMVLGVTIAAEVAGKVVLNSGLTTQLRPRKYYTVPRETLDALIGDVHELVNFFVIESQRVLFAENVLISTAAFLGAFVSYFLVKIVPYWGLALIATTTVFFVPLVYSTNQELIDAHVKQAGDVVNAQAAQLRLAAQKHTSNATQLTKQYMGDYTTKAQQMVRGRSASPEVVPKPEPAAKEYKPTDFPAAPKDELTTEEAFKPAEESVKTEAEPLVAL